MLCISTIKAIDSFQPMQSLIVLPKALYFRKEPRTSSKELIVCRKISRMQTDSKKIDAYGIVQKDSVHQIKMCQYTYTTYWSAQRGSFYRTATHCSALQHTAKYPSRMPKSKSICSKRILLKHCNTLQHTATHCNTLQHLYTSCPIAIQSAQEGSYHHTTAHCNTPQHTATHCNTPQHTATHRNTPQHTYTGCPSASQCFEKESY